MKAVAEGVLTSRSAHLLAQKARAPAGGSLLEHRHRARSAMRRSFNSEILVVRRAWRRRARPQAGLRCACAGARDGARGRARQVGVSAPILSAVFRIVHERADALATLDALMRLDLTPEVDEETLAASAATHLLAEGDRVG